MDFPELVKSRRTVHNYRSEKIEDRLVEEALNLSLWAPNHHLTFPWCYVWVGPKTRSEVQKKATADNFLNPSHLIALAVRRQNDSQRAHEDYATLAASVQIASLYLWQQGVATKWSTSKALTHEKTYQILNLDPAQYSLEGGLMIGKALHIPPAPKRPSLDALVKRVD